MERILFRTGLHAVSLSVLTPDDAEFCTRGMNDSNITQYLLRRFPITVASERKWLESLPAQEMTDQVFGITVTETEELIGMMGLHSINWINRTATTGAWISSDSCRGKGYGSEAKLLLLDYAFNTLGLRKISSNVLATNMRSKAYNIKCGYAVEGIRTKQIYVNGTYVDEVSMAIFKETFETLWSRYTKNL